MIALYYRDSERITEKERKEIHDFYGDTNHAPYNWIKEVEVNDEFDCHPDVEPLFHVIQNNKELNERSQALIERVKRTKKPTAKGECPMGYTDSKGSWFCVEQHLLHDLLDDANKVLKKEEGFIVELYKRKSDFYRYYASKP